MKNSTNKINLPLLILFLLLGVFSIGVSADDSNATEAQSVDICYSTPYTEDADLLPMSICMGFGGVNCRNIIPIVNISGDDLTNVEVTLTSDGIMSGSFNDDCGVKDDLGTCENDSDHTVGGEITIFGYSFVYTLDDMTPEDNSRDTYTESAISINFNNKLLYATYTKNGIDYYSEVNPCPEGAGISLLTGPFDAWDTYRNINDRNISTKISAKDFDLTIASINDENTETETKDGIKIKYQLFDLINNENISDWYDYDASSDAEITASFNVNSVYKQAIVRFKVCADYNGTAYALYTDTNCTSDCSSNTEVTDSSPCFRYFRSSDDFAIRPYRFLITNTPVSSVKAGDEFNITIQALDFNGNKTKDYNEALNITSSTSPYLKHNETKIGCITGDLNNSSTLDFTNGEINVTLRYSEIGDLNLTIGENNDTGTFAYVDENDTSITQLLIDKNTTIIRILPDHFEINATLKDFANKFTYLSKDLNISAILDVNVTAKNEQNITTRNYNSACYAKKTDYDISYGNLNISPLGSLSKILYLETNSSKSGNSPINSDINLTDVNEGIFATGDNNGTAILRYLINFDREKNATVNPFILNIKDINVTDANNTFGNINLDKNVTFYYGRVHAPDYRFDGSSGTATVYYEVYSNQNQTLRNSFGITGKESIDSIDWYNNLLHTNTNEGDYTGNATPVAKDGTNISNIQLKSMLLTTTPPHKDKITMYPNSWLIYDRFNSNASTSSFLVEFNIAGATWAGKGIQGKTVDLNISATQNKRLDW